MKIDPATKRLRIAGSPEKATPFFASPVQYECGNGAGGCGGIMYVVDFLLSHQIVFLNFC